MSRLNATKVVVKRREGASLAILVIGGVVYFFLCGPSIVQRGYPPLDPIWWAMTFMWVFPLLFSCWFDSWSFPSRQVHLWCYAIVTALVYSATPVTMVPKSLFPVEIVFGTILLYGPFHSGITFGVEAAVQGLLGRWRRFCCEDEYEAFALRPRSFSLLAYFYLFTVTCTTIGFPFAFQNFAVLTKRGWARQQAESDWKQGEPFIYDEPEEVHIGDARIEYEVDRNCGLRVRRQFVTDVYAGAYNGRIRELLATQPLPFSTVKLPSPQQLFALLDATDLTEVTTFPQDVSSGIVVFRNGSVTRWGHTASNSSDSLAITTKAGGGIDVGNGAQRVFFGSIDGCPGLIVIRNGSTWLGVFEEDGRQVASASRFP